MSSSLAMEFQYTTLEMNIIVSLMAVRCQCCCLLLSPDGLCNNPAVCSSLQPFLCLFISWRLKLFCFTPSFNLKVVFLFLGDSACCVRAQAPCACVLCKSPLYRCQTWKLGVVDTLSHFATYALAIRTRCKYTLLIAEAEEWRWRSQGQRRGFLKWWVLTDQRSISEPADPRSGLVVPLEHTTQRHETTKTSNGALSL